MPLGNNIGSRTGKLVMTSTPKGNGWVSVSGSVYQKNQKDETDPKGKLVIQNYSKNLDTMIIWGWNLLSTDELDDSYTFQLTHYQNPKIRIYITLGRELQQLPTDIKYSETFYQCYIHDDEGKWDHTDWFSTSDLSYTKFWKRIEKIIDKYEPVLPF